MTTEFRFEGQELETLGGAASRFRHNLAALRLLKRLESETRPAGDLTAEEQLTLARYSGWGDTEALRLAFPQGTYAWAKPHAELEGLLTPEETSSLLASSLNAHYTSLPVIQAIYTALEHYGLASDSGNRLLEFDARQSVALGSWSHRKLRVLEPAAGVGHWIGMMPPLLRANSERVAVEIDALTGRILQQLYPNTKVLIQPFEEALLPENYFDLILSNVPFGNYAIADASVRENFLKAAIHDYFFAKSLRLLQPGGILAFITSRYTLDKASPKVRRYLATHAELLAAARLPRNAFRANAGTEVITDVLILRKRGQPCREVNDSWVETEAISLRNARDEELEFTINAYYREHPDYLLGTPTFGRGMYQPHEFILQDDGRDLAKSLAQCLCAQLPAHGYQSPRIAELPEPTQAATPDESLLPSANLSERDRQNVAALQSIYTAAKAVIAIQLRDAAEEELQLAQQELGELYENYKQRFGYLSKHLGKLNPHSPAVPFLKALEIPVGKNLVQRAPLFTQRTIRPARRTPSHLLPKEALLLCLHDLGRVDLRYLMQSCQNSRAEVLTALDGLIYETPIGAYVTAEEYLSGDVRQKLREAERAATCNPSFAPNVAALRAVQPAELGRDEIIVRLGAGWVPENIVSDFVVALVPSFSGAAHYLSALAVWKIENAGTWARNSVEANQTWGTSRVNAFELLEDILNLRTTTITDEATGTDGKPRRVVNDNETIAAQAKQLEIKQKFAAWVWQDEERAATLIKIYNERFNAFRKREYDGSHLSLPGMSTEIELYAHQKNSIWRILQSRATLLAHCVGAGKTFVMLAAAMELKRLGLCHKALIVVPNHLPAQWAAEALRLYPNLRLLAPRKEHLTSAQRGELLSRIATSDYDAIIIPQTAFTMLPLQPTTVREYIEREIETLHGYLEEFETASSKNRRSIKEIQRALKQRKVKLEATEQQIQRLNCATMTWEELGIDALFIDEFHHYKNLYCPTKMTRVAGLPNTDSQRAFDCLMKVRSVLDHGGRVVCATATPVSNTIAEVYVCQKYLQLETLQALGLDHFDAWVQQFAETTQSLEMTPDGSGFRMNTRFNKFTNIPELSQLWQQVLEVKSAAELHLPRPKLKDGKPEIISVPASEELKAYVHALARRVEAIKGRRVAPHVDNMLKVTSDGRKAALDLRLVRPDAPRPAESKVMALVDQLERLYHETRETRGTQLVFLDLSTPKGKSELTNKE